MYESSQVVVFENLASELKEMLSCKSIDISTFNSTQVLKKKHELACDDECLVAERNVQFAQALQVEPGSAAAATTPHLSQLYAPPGGISVGGGFVVLGKATKPLYTDYLKVVFFTISRVRREVTRREMMKIRVCSNPNFLSFQRFISH